MGNVVLSGRGEDIAYSKALTLELVETTESQLHISLKLIYEKLKQLGKLFSLGQFWLMGEKEGLNNRLKFLA